MKFNFSNALESTNTSNIKLEELKLDDYDLVKKFFKKNVATTSSEFCRSALQCKNIQVRFNP